MDVAHIGADGDDVKTRELGGNDAALKTCVDNVNDGILAGHLAVGTRVEVAPVSPLRDLYARAYRA